MTHPRKIIRDAVAAALLADGLAGGRVWTSRAKPLSERTAPAVLVYTPTDRTMKGSYDADGQGSLDRELTLAIEIVDFADDDDEASLEDRLDAMAERVEALLDGFEAPGRAADIVRYHGMESDLFERGKHIFGAKLITYTVGYRVGARPAEDAALGATATANLILDGASGRAALPAGAAPESILWVDSADGAARYMEGVDYMVDRDGAVPVLVRLGSGMIPDGARLNVIFTLPPPAAVAGVYLGQAPDIGRGREADYTRVHPRTEGA